MHAAQCTLRMLNIQKARFGNGHEAAAHLAPQLLLQAELLLLLLRALERLLLLYRRGVALRLPLPGKRAVRSFSGATSEHQRQTPPAGGAAAAGGAGGAGGVGGAGGRGLAGAPGT